MKNQTKKKLLLGKKTIANLRTVNLKEVKAGKKGILLGTDETFCSCFFCTDPLAGCESTPATCAVLVCDPTGPE